MFLRKIIATKVHYVCISTVLTLLLLFAPFLLAIHGNYSLSWFFALFLLSILLWGGYAYCSLCKESLYEEYYNKDDSLKKFKPGKRKLLDEFVRGGRPFLFLLSLFVNFYFLLPCIREFFDSDNFLITPVKAFDLSFNGEITSDTFIAGGAALFALLLLWVTFLQWKTSLKISRATQINSLIEKIRGNKDISDFIYMIEYRELDYEDSHRFVRVSLQSSNGNGGRPAFHRKSDKRHEIERKVDFALGFFASICYMRRQGVLEEKEFVFFRYNIINIISYEPIKRYLKALNELAESRQRQYDITNKTPYSVYYLIDYAMELNIWDNEGIYPFHYQYLNLSVLSS